MTDEPNGFGRYVMPYSEIWKMVHGREGTPEEIEHSRRRSLMILDELKLQLSDSDDIWKELDKPC